MCLKHGQGNAIDRKTHHIRPTSATIQDNPKAKDPVVLFPENVDTPSKFNIGNAPFEKPPPEDSLREHTPNMTTRSERNVVCF